MILVCVGKTPADSSPSVHHVLLTVLRRLVLRLFPKPHRRLRSNPLDHLQLLGSLRPHGHPKRPDTPQRHHARERGHARESARGARGAITWRLGSGSWRWTSADQRQIIDTVLLAEDVSSSAPTTIATTNSGSATGAGAGTGAAQADATSTGSSSGSSSNGASSGARRVVAGKGAGTAMAMAMTLLATLVMVIQ